MKPLLVQYLSQNRAENDKIMVFLKIHEKIDRVFKGDAWGDVTQTTLKISLLYKDWPLGSPGQTTYAGND